MNTEQQEHIGRATVTMQIIVFALVMGVLVFAGIVIFLQKPGEGVDGEAGVNTIAAACAALVALVATVIVPRILRHSMRQAIAEGRPLGSNIPAPVMTELGDVGQLAAVYQTTLIVGAAILESAAFYNLIAYQLEHQTINLVGAAILLTALIFKFPTRSAIENWVTGELKLIEELRSLGS